jgi:hypothetical protein
VLEDSGGPAELTGLDPDTGATIAEIKITGAVNVDWEDLALGPCPQGTCLYIADTGDNQAVRTDIRILRIPEPTTLGTQSALPETFPLELPGGPADIEALTVNPDGGGLLLTKVAGGEPAWLSVEFASTAVQTAGVLAPISPGEAVGPVTAADPISQDEMLVRTYNAVYRVGPTGWVRLPAAIEPQGETIAWDPYRCGYWQVSEGVQPPLHFGSCASSAS